MLTPSWNFESTEQFLGMQLADLTQDDRNEIVAYTHSGCVYIFTIDGKIIHKEIPTVYSPIWKLKIAAFTKSGEKCIISGSLDGSLRVFQLNRSLELISKWAHKFDASISGFLVDDINFNGEIEIIAYSLDKSLRVLSLKDGTLIWGQVFGSGIGDALICKIDSKKTVFGAGNDGTIRSFDGNNGNLLNFVEFEDKMRCVLYSKFGQKNIIICGGDDKKAHFLEFDLQREIKTVIFDNILWKIKQHQNSIILSSYSFDFLNNNQPKEKISYTSKIRCFDDILNLKWELDNINTEVIYPWRKYVLFGTTNGNIIIVNPEKGQILYEENILSCVNDICFDSKSNQIFTCHDNGLIYGYFIK